MSMSVLDQIAQQLDPQTLRQIGNQIGLDPGTTQQAVATALPVLVTALARNASTDQGAHELAGALQRDQHGSILDDLGGFLGGGNAGGLGGAILGHVLGGRQGQTEAAIGRASGIDMGQAAKLLAMLAPIVMAVLGRRGSQTGFDIGDLVGMLQGDRARVEQAQPGGGDLLTSILDRDGDGQVGDDLAQLGASVLGGIFGGKR
jgi:hypothetical protein